MKAANVHLAAIRHQLRQPEARDRVDAIERVLRGSTFQCGGCWQTDCPAEFARVSGDKLLCRTCAEAPSRQRACPRCGHRTLLSRCPVHLGTHTIKASTADKINDTLGEIRAEHGGER